MQSYRRIGVTLASTVLALLLLPATFAPTALAKDKSKAILPLYVLQARTVAVVIDPQSGVDPNDPQANRVAQKDVEAALAKWGRLQPLVSTQSADLIIVVRRGNQRLVNETIPDPRQNSRPGVIRSTDDSVSVGAQAGRPPRLSDEQTGSTNVGAGHPQVEVATPQDTFFVYQGNVDHPLDAIPAWRYGAIDALRPHGVPAVDEFRKAIAAAEKAAAQKP